MSSTFKQRWQRQAALSFSVILGGSAVVIATLAICATATGWPRALGLCAIGLQMLWVIAESAVARRELNLGFTQSDGYSMELYAASRFLFVVVTMLSFTKLTVGALALGLGVSIAGILFRFWAIHKLGRFYSHRVRKQQDHQIISDGPYRFVRHPAYLGMLVGNLGLLIGFPSLASALVLFGCFIPAIIYRIKREDKMLHSIPGYAAYASVTKNLLPILW